MSISSIAIFCRKPGNSMISESEENTQVITDDEDAIDLTSSASEYSFNDGNNQTNAGKNNKCLMIINNGDNLKSTCRR